MELLRWVLSRSRAGCFAGRRRHIFLLRAVLSTTMRVWSSAVRGVQGTLHVWWCCMLCWCPAKLTTLHTVWIMLFALLILHLSPHRCVAS
jgi:hypothetical protein